MISAIRSTPLSPLQTNGKHNEWRSNLETYRPKRPLGQATEYPKIPKTSSRNTKTRFQTVMHGGETHVFSHSTAYFIQNEYKASIDRLTTKSHQREPFRQFA